MKTYRKIDDTKIEEISTSSRIITKEFIERELEAVKENIKASQKKVDEFEDLLNKFKNK